MIKIKPIIRPIDEADRLVDVVDIEGDQVAVVIRSFPTKELAMSNDNVIVEEDFDAQAIQDFLDARVAAEFVATEQAAIDTAQDKVTARLADAMDKLLGFIATAHTLTAPQQAFVDDFRNDYAAWVAIK